MLIDGEWIDAEEAYEIRNPASEEIVATVAKGHVEHADRAVASAKCAFRSGVWSGKSPEERSQIMVQIAERLATDLEELLELECSANGATIRQAAGFHVGLASPHFMYFAELAAAYQFEQAPPPLTYPTLSANKIRREPIGVCAGIVPWNFPLVLGIWKIAPALAAGNSIVVKPDEHTPLSLIHLARIALECGVPAGVLNIVTGDGPEVGARLASHPDVGKVAFTGSTEVGREIMRLASGTVKKVSLELGGKGAAVILDDADLDAAVDAALFGSWLFCGQMCESCSRVIVPDSIHDEFVERLIERAKTVKLGDPADFDTDMGPVINDTQRTRILSYIEIGRQEGATVAFGGGAPTGEGFERGYWVQPTILTDVRNDMRVAQEEIFGPVLSVIRYSGDEDEAVQIANGTEYGLSSAVWSSDYERALSVADRLEAGTIWVNDVHMVSAAHPFGGYKQSGLGRELGPRALDEYTEAKHVHVDLTQKRESRLYDLLLSEPPARPDDGTLPVRGGHVAGGGRSRP
jgi:acyl-CoA reductase-like NAD-dependent aldehyde dehydrogenase